LSSVEEALPTVLIEALAVGLPIVATDCPSGPREILRDGAYGTLVTVGDSAALAEGLLRVLKQPLRPSIPDEALAPFQHDHVVREYLSILGLNGDTRNPSYSQAGTVAVRR
jgi:glycosyltransferase involved in cell wall biosynthesis